MRENLDSIGYAKDQINFPVLVVCGYSDAVGYTPFFIDSYDELKKLVDEFSHDDESSILKIVGLCKDASCKFYRLDIEIEIDVGLDGERKTVCLQVIPVSLKSDFVYDVCNFMKKLHNTIASVKDMIKGTMKPAS